jgi:WD40 repeat protein
MKLPVNYNFCWREIMGKKTAVLSSLLALAAAALLLLAAKESSPDSKDYKPSYQSEYQSAHDILVDSLTTEQMDLKPEIFPQLGHISTGFTEATFVCFTPDGKYVLTGHGRAGIILWDYASGREIRSFMGATDRITSLAVSKNGKYAVSSDEGFKDNIKLWDIFTGKIIKSFNGQGGLGGTLAVAFSPDGKYIFCGDKKETIRSWDIATGKEWRSYKAAKNAEDSLTSINISSMAFSPDGKYLVSGSRSNSVSVLDDGTVVRAESKGNTIRIWDIGSGEQINEFNHNWVQAVTITPDGKYVVSGDYEDSLRVWDIGTGKQVKAFDCNGISSLAISYRGKYALLGGCMNLKVWDLAEGKVIREFGKDISGWVRSVAFSPDGKFALFGDDGSKPKLIDIASGKEAMSYGGYVQEVTAAALSADGKYLLAGQADRFLILWDIHSGRQVKTMAHTLGVTSVALSRDGTRAAAGGWDFKEHASTVKCWDMATGNEIQTIKNIGEPCWARNVAITSDGMKIFQTVSNKIILADISTGKELRKIEQQGPEIQKAMVSDNARYALTYNQQGLGLWNLSTGEMINSFEGYQGILSSDGKTVLLLRNDRYARKGILDFKLWDIPSNREIRSQGIDFKGEINMAVFLEAISRDSRYVLCSTSENDLHLLDISNGKEIKIFTGHARYITAAGFCPDNKQVYSGSTDGTIRLWDVNSGKELAQFVSFTDGEWIVITPEGYFNASPNGAKHLNVRVGMNVYSIDNFFENFYNPVYVSSVLQGNKVEAAADIRKGIALPPEVKIISPETGAEFSRDEVIIQVSAKDIGGGIDEIRLYHNGKAIDEHTRGIRIVPQGKEVVKTYTVTLVDGPNTFRATAFSKDRTESNPYEITVTLAAPQKDCALYVLAVGINTYKNPALSLNYAEPDARGIVDFFKNKGTGLFKHVYIKEIYNEEATKTGIIAIFTQLQNTNPQDVVLIYLAGHGENVNDKWYFIPYELTYPEREEDVKAQGLSSEELAGYIQKIKAQKVLVLIDACKAGAALVAFRGFEDRKALLQLSRSTGVHIVAASTKSQFAAEVRELGHGLFTYTLLEGLNGKAAGKGETVTVRKLMGYIEEQLPEITKKYKKEAQYPVVDSRGMDFPLVISK